MFVLMAIHIVQSGASLINIYGITANRAASIFCVVVGAIIPFLAYTYIVLETIILAKCDSLLQIWLITDLQVLFFTVLSFIYRTWKNYRRRKNQEGIQ